MKLSSKPKRYLSVLSFLMLGPAHAAELQIFSVMENPAGTVRATIGIFSDTTPDASAFRLKLNDKAIAASTVKPVPSFALENRLIIAIDQSRSMGRIGIKHIQDALRSVFSKSELQVNLALWAFDTEVRKLHDFSRNTTQLTTSVGEIGRGTTQNGKTKLWEAIELGLAELRSHNASTLKHLVVVTDGKDVGSIITDQIIANQANAQNITINAIGFGHVENKDAELLSRLAQNTGGQYVHVTESKSLGDALQRLFNLPPPRVFDVLFRYDAQTGHQIQSAQLEFMPAGKTPVLQTITQGLSEPRVAPPPVPSPEDKWTINILSINIDLRVLIGILVGFLALAGAYMLSKRPAPLPKPNSVPPPPPPPQPSTIKVPPSGPGVSKRQQHTVVGYFFPSPSPGHPAAILRGLEGPARGQRYPIEQTTYRIGSSEKNELRLSDDYLSGRHASIRYDSSSLYLNDDNSRNGTFLNGMQLDLSARALTPGDNIRVGKSTLEVVAVSSQGYSSHRPAGNDGEPFVR